MTTTMLAPWSYVHVKVGLLAVLRISADYQTLEKSWPLLHGALNQASFLLRCEADFVCAFPVYSSQGEPVQAKSELLQMLSNAGESIPTDTVCAVNVRTQRHKLRRVFCNGNLVITGGLRTHMSTSSIVFCRNRLPVQIVLLLLPCTDNDAISFSYFLIDGVPGVPKRLL